MQGKKTGSEGRITAAYFSAKRKKNVPLSIPGRSGNANRQMIRILRGIVQDPANDCLTDWAEISSLKPRPAYGQPAVSLL